MACDAAAPQALATCAPGWPTPFVAQRTRRPTPPDAQRGRPGPGTHPAQVVSQLAGAHAMRVAARQARSAPHRGFILATQELAETRSRPQERCAGHTGQAPAERGVRVRKAAQVLAASRALTTPARLMALLRVMTVCVLVDAALEERMRTARKAHAATCPDPNGTRLQNPTARGVCHAWVGMPG